MKWLFFGRWIATFKPVYGLLAAMLIGFLAFSLINKKDLLPHWSSSENPRSQNVIQNNEPLKALPILSNNRFDHLRDASFLGNHVVMLRHRHTSQRLIVMMASENASYKAMFNQGLSKTEFSVFMTLFKPNTSFRDKTLSIQTVSLRESRTLKQGTYTVPYKIYDIATAVDGKIEPFEAYFAYLPPISPRHHTSEGIVLTFNSKDYTSLEPFKDLMDALQEKPLRPRS